MIALRTPLPPHLAPDFAYDATEWKDWYARQDRPELIVVNSGELDGMGFREGIRFPGRRNCSAREGRTPRSISACATGASARQRYWGCPIPIVYCDKCGAVPVPESQLPVMLPEDVAFSGTGSPIKTDPDWRKTTCPSCGGPAERETDTFDTFMESSWYYARYTSPGAQDLVDERANYWLPVDHYIGGIEHAIMHLMYFRFYHKLMRDAGLVNSDEPATNLLCQGMVIADTFYRENADGSKDLASTPPMSTSQRDDKGRTMGATAASRRHSRCRSAAPKKCPNPKTTASIRRPWSINYGADTVRLFSMFAAPPEQSLDWNESGVEGMSRFLRRLWAQANKHVALGRPPGDRCFRVVAGGEIRCGANCTRPSRRSVTTTVADIPSTPPSPR